MNRPSRSEVFARDAFDRFLARVEASEHDWRCGSDPPDWVLTLGSHELAVEVTSVWQRAHVGRRAFSVGAIYSDLYSLCEEVRTRAAREGLPHGAYTLEVVAIPNLRSVRPQIVSACMAFLWRTRNAETELEVEIWRRNGARVVMEKHHSGSNYIASIVSVTDRGQLASELEAELAPLLEGELDKKVTKLGDGASTTIVLVVDEFYDADVKAWRMALPDRLKRVFHTVARITGLDHVQVLASVESRWSGLGGSSPVA